MTKVEKENASIIFLILLTVAAIYGRVIHFDFLWDDISLIVRNPYITKSIPLKEIFGSGFWRFSTNEAVSPYYRPLVTLAYITEYKLFGLMPRGYHVVNLLLHLANILLVWKIAIKLGFNRMQTSLVSLLFALHPAQVGTVCFISCHGDLLAMIFSLLAFYFWIHENKIRLIALVFTLLAMLSKEIAIFLPIILFLYDWMIRKKAPKEITKYLPALIWLIYFPLRIYGLRNVYPFTSENGLIFSVGSFRIFLFIARILFPIPIGPDDGLPEISNYQKILYHIAFVMLIVIVMMKTKQKNFIRFLLIWFFLTLLPIADWFNFGLRFSDQLLYFSLLPFCFLIGIFVVNQKNALLMGVVAIFFICISISQIGYWKNANIFWNHALKNYPQVTSYAVNYSLSLSDSGQIKNSCEVMEYAWKIAQKKYHPFYYNIILYNLGVCNADQHPDVAIDYYKKALMVRNNDLMSRKNLIPLLIRVHAEMEALKQAQILTDTNPNNPESWMLLGQAFRANGNKIDSEKALEKAKSLDIKL